MNYCENCHLVSDEPRCPLCGNKKLRPPEKDDFCLLTENNPSYCGMLAEIFKENGIECVTLPYGSGVETQFGLPLRNCRLFVPHASLKAAEEIIAEIESAETEKLKSRLLENVNKLNVLPGLEKKIRKKMKIAADTDFSEYCATVIKTAGKISDEGLITGCGKHGHYLICISENARLIINSKTFEILLLSK